MKLIAKKNLLHRPKGKLGLTPTKAIKAGDTFECDEEQAEKIIARGDAVLKPKATRRPKTEDADDERAPE